jgi:aldehyde dehydrogenase (NAD+)
VGYLKSGTILHGGRFNKDRRFIEPTLMDGVGVDDTIMKEEIFGPILPVLTYKNKSEITDIIRKNRYPLACYIFSNDKKFQDNIIENIEFGGGAINNALVHLANPNLPFGGVGNSGMGNYHGKKSFDEFSHSKSILSTSTHIDIKLRYAPYNKSKMKWARLLFR